MAKDADPNAQMHNSPAMNLCSRTLATVFRMPYMRLLAELGRGSTPLQWAAVFGALIFDEVADAATWFGAAIIIASGMIIIFREARALR